jgi:hypothetical protein
MNVIITHYKKADNGRDTVYFEGKPVRQVTTVKLPIEFGYGSYNEPRKIKNMDINVDDIISMEAEGEMQL